jgi:hypothetical protein
MKLVTASVLASALACSVALVAQSGPRRDGNWEVTTQTSMNGMPPGPARKETRCVTKEEASNPTAAAPAPPQGRGGPAPDCKVAEQKITGNTATWTTKCTGSVSLEMSGEVVYSGDTYTGTTTTTMNMNGQAMSVKSTFTGKRLGDCVK